MLSTRLNAPAQNTGGAAAPVVFCWPPRIRSEVLPDVLSRSPALRFSRIPWRALEGHPR